MVGVRGHKASFALLWELSEVTQDLAGGPAARREERSRPPPSSRTGMQAGAGS